MRISNEVSNVLAESRVEGAKLFLPDYQLERSLYVSVNKVLTAIGGKWNRKAKAHLFEENVEDIVEEVIQTGSFTDSKKEFQEFFTPDNVAREIVDLIDSGLMLDDFTRFLEPSAGRGAIARYLKDKTLHVIEIQKKNREVLQSLGMTVIYDDFMNFEPDRKYDVIIANPPFTRQQDIDHVNKMLDLANEQVISVMSGSVLWRDNRKTTDFRVRVADLGGTITALPEGTFASSGTMINTCLLNVRIR